MDLSQLMSIRELTSASVCALILLLRLGPERGYQVLKDQEYPLHTPQKYCSQPTLEKRLWQPDLKHLDFEIFLSPFRKNKRIELWKFS